MVNCVPLVTEGLLVALWLGSGKAADPDLRQSESEGVIYTITLKSPLAVFS